MEFVFNQHISLLLKQLRSELKFKHLLPSLITAIVLTVMNITIVIAYATLLFKQDLSRFTIDGISYLMLGTAITSIWVALSSSIQGVISRLQTNTVTLLVIVIGSITTIHSEQSQDLEITFNTALAAIMLTSLLTGFIFFFLGKLKSGNLIRYIPYPVVGGFLTGSGLLLIKGATSLLFGKINALSQIHLLFQPTRLACWLPGIVFGCLILFITRKNAPFWVLPTILLTATLIYHLGLKMADLPLLEAIRAGLIPPPPQKDMLFQPVNYAGLLKADWELLLNQSGTILAIVLINAIHFLLNVTGIETDETLDVDLNQELKTAGINNLLLGTIGSSVGYHAASYTILAKHTKGNTRLTGIFASILLFFSMISGGKLVAIFPIAILGGLLFYLGLEFLAQWLYDTWNKIPTMDYFIIVIISITIVAIGFLEGIGLGLLMTSFLFILQYRSIGIARSQHSGRAYYSFVERPKLFRQLLKKKDDWLYTFELQGFIFFGTAYDLYHNIQDSIINSVQKPHYLILDFRLVVGLDLSATNSFKKVINLANQHNVQLVFTGLKRTSHNQLIQLLNKCKNCHLLPTLNQGVEWCEEQMIATFESVGLAARDEPIHRQLRHMLSEKQYATQLLDKMTRMELSPGHTLINQGDSPTGIYFLESGQVSIYAHFSDHETVRLRTLGSGAIIGEMGYYRNENAVADVIAERPSVVYFLSSKDIADMEQNNCPMAIVFHHMLSAQLCDRVQHQNNTIATLLGN